jgi:glycosyltransferase involved in cell wall biosynthesis
MIDQEVGWHGPMLQSCAGFRPGEVDLVLGTGPPFCVFNLSARVAARLHAPFVLDYRDLWTLSPHLHCEPPPRDFRREQASLHQASGVVVVSEPMADCLQRRFNLPARPCIVTNGFDSDDFRDLQPKEFDDFAVVYAGNFYPPKRVIDPVIGAIRLANEGAAAGQRAIRLHYYGRDAGHVQEAAQAQRATECVVIHGFVPRQEVLAAMKGAGAAAVITSVESKASAADDSILTGKLFEAIGTGAPILLVAPTGTEVARVVERPGAGRAFSGSQIQPMADWLRKLAHGKSPVAARELSEYSWPQLALQADAFLRQLLAEPKNSESIPRTRGG